MARLRENEVVAGVSLGDRQSGLMGMHAAQGNRHQARLLEALDVKSQNELKKLGMEQQFQAPLRDAEIAQKTAYGRAVESEAGTKAKELGLKEQQWGEVGKTGYQLANLMNLAGANDALQLLGLKLNDTDVNKFMEQYGFSSRKEKPASQTMPNLNSVTQEGRSSGGEQSIFSKIKTTPQMVNYLLSSVGAGVSGTNEMLKLLGVGAENPVGGVDWIQQYMQQYGMLPK